MPAIASEIRKLADDLHVEEVEFYGKENASAGRRARKILQQIKMLCANSRKEITEIKNNAKGA